MKVTQSRLEDGRIELAAMASSEESRLAIDYAYAAFARLASLQVEEGQTIEEAALTKLGIHDLSAHVTPYAIEHLIPIAINKSGIQPAFTPHAHDARIESSDAGSINFTFTVTPKPHHELSSYDPVAISVVEPVLFEEDVEREMEQYQSLMNSFDDPDKSKKLRVLVIDKLEHLNAQSFANQKRQAVAIELAKRLEGDLADDIVQQTFLDSLKQLQDKIIAQGSTFKDFLEEHGGEENVDMLVMWQAREALRQGYALDAVYRHEKLAISETDIRNACCTITGIQDSVQAYNQVAMAGKTYVAIETAQRFKATDWLIGKAVITVREQSPLEG